MVYLGRGRLVSGALCAIATSSAIGVINPAIAGTGPSPASFIVNNDGTLYAGAEDWVTPATVGIAALYQVKVDPTSGSFSGGDVTGTWLDCSSTRQWDIASGTVVFTVSFREKASGQVRSVQTGIGLGD